MKGDKTVVSIVMGSDSDMEVMRNAADVLDEFGVGFEILVASAHRAPKKAAEFAKTARLKGIKVIIAAAGYAAHLPGVIASYTTLPVIGVPLDVSSLDGLDSLLSIVQMPTGVPVATVTIGKVGVKNAAILAVEILALSDKRLAKKLEIYRKKHDGNSKRKS